jgi:hypothetical protein
LIDAEISEGNSMSLPQIKDLHDQTRTPRNPPPDYDWRKELWVNDEPVRSLSYYIAFHVIVAMRTAGDDKIDERDNVTLTLLCPEITEMVWKGQGANEVIDNRIACAAAMGIDKLISQWMKRFGSIDAKGPPSKLARKGMTH